MKGEKISIVIADDHTIFREGVKKLLQAEDHLVLEGEASNGQDLLEIVKHKQPDVILTDIVMPVLNGIEAVRALGKQYPDIGIIALSMFDEEQLVIEMMEAGALGYLLKDTGKKQLIDAVHSVNEKKPYYSESISARMIKRIAQSTFDPYAATVIPALTHTEVEIIIGVCKGYTNKEIASELKHTKRTIEIYRKNLMDKLEVRSLAGLVIYAIKKGIYKV